MKKHLKTLRGFAERLRLCLLVILMLGVCGLQAQNAGGADDRLAQAIRSLPDSLKVNPFGGSSGYTLSAAQTQTMLSEGSVAEKGYEWMFTPYDAGDFVRIERSGGDEVLAYDLLLITQKKKSWILVVQQLGDHCCNYSRFGLYAWKNGRLVDQTQKAMPQVGWGDFFEAELIKNPLISPMVWNRYPCSTAIYPENRSLGLSLVGEYISMSYPEVMANTLLSALKEDPKVLMWNGKRFVWAEE